MPTKKKAVVKKKETTAQRKKRWAKNPKSNDVDFDERKPQKRPKQKPSSTTIHKAVRKAFFHGGSLGKPKKKK